MLTKYDRMGGPLLVVLFAEHMLKGAKNKTHSNSTKVVSMHGDPPRTKPSATGGSQMRTGGENRRFLCTDGPKETQKPT